VQHDSGGRSLSAKCTPINLFCLALMSFSSYGNISNRVNRLGDAVRKHRPGTFLGNAVF
jgi:hypothetical protein